MNRNNALRLTETLPPNARVVDVGGGASAFPRADYVIDAVPYEARNVLGEVDVACRPRYSRETWRQVDLCHHTPWPFEDQFFDFAVCSHLLEDVRDPIWICHELCRVAKAGYIEVPSRIVEQSLGVEHPSYAGYYHHRWLITARGNRLEFRQKPHSLHSIRDAIVAHVGPWNRINPEHEILTFEWQGGFEFEEVLEFDESRTIAELCDFAAGARRLPDLLVPSHRSTQEAVRRMIYYQRLKSGRRDSMKGPARTSSRRDPDPATSPANTVAEGIDRAPASR